MSSIQVESHFAVLGERNIVVEKNWEINLANLFSTLKTCDRHFQSKNFDFSWSISSKVANETF